MADHKTQANSPNNADRRGNTEAQERPHPTTASYLKVGIVLALITAIEVGIFYMESIRSVIVPIFLVLSAGKFALVAMFYMHLRFDARLFSGFFVGGILLATSIIAALLALFSTSSL
jgi:cytochrome c oxidase subunit 4